MGNDPVEHPRSLKLWYPAAEYNHSAPPRHSKLEVELPKSRQSPPHKYAAKTSEVLLVDRCYRTQTGRITGRLTLGSKAMRKLLLISLLAALTARGEDYSKATARPVPSWLREGVIYEIFPRNFSQEANFNG